MCLILRRPYTVTLSVAVTASGDAARSAPKAIVAVLHHGPGGDAGEDGDLYMVSTSDVQGA